MEQQYQCLIIGSGPGGYVAAIRAAQLGLKTAIIEKDQLGGRCLNYACIPAKAVLRSADIISEIEHAKEFGISAPQPTIDFEAVHNRQRQVINTLTGGVAMLLKKNGVEVIEGKAMLAGQLSVTVDQQEITASEAIILAAGSVPLPLPGGQFTERVIATEKAWALKELPEKIAVVGSGASGSELASAYARLGSKVQLIEIADRVLPSEDPDISRIAERAFKAQGIEVRTGQEAEHIEDHGSHVSYTLGEEAFEVDYLMVAAGREVDIDGLGLTVAGIELDQNRKIPVDKDMQTKVPGIYAIGDLVAGPALAHKASEEAIIAAEKIAGLQPHPLNYQMIPRATFCNPQIGSFGMSETEAKQAGHQITVGKAPYGAVGAGAVTGDKSGMVKIIGDKQYGEILGASIIGSKATELIQQLVNYEALEGGYPELARQIHGHPTLSEAILEAARSADGWIIHG